jgi:serine/threonine protein phosphatase PrpC
VTGLTLQCAARTDVGRRPNNEDAVFASPRLAAVADGVGGAAAGEVASRTLINALVHVDKCRLEGRLDEALAAGIAWGNETIGFIAGCRPAMAGMSTTVTAVALGDDGCIVANLGDSRTYLLRDGALAQLTHDDSWVQLMIDSGELTAAQAREHPRRSLVLAALDGEPDRRPVLRSFEARPGDRLLLCSDGLSDVVDDATIAATLDDVADRAECATRLIELALAAGGRDNVSAVVADVAERRDHATAW